MKTKLGMIALLCAALCIAGVAMAQTQPREANVNVIAGPIAQKITPNSAEVTWETNSPSSTILKYGTDPNNLQQTAQKPWGQQTHHVEISNLQPDTLYWVVVQGESGRELGRSNFKTAPAGQTAQFNITHGPSVEQVGPDSVVIAWTTSAPSSSTVMYGNDPNNLNQKAEAPWGQQTHRVTVNNLQPNTKYWFAVQSGQAQGTGQTAQSQPFPVVTISSGQAAMKFDTR